jgi:hypothetical protein
MKTENQVKLFSNASLVEQPEQLKHIHEKDKNIAIWERNIDDLAESIRITELSLQEPLRVSGTFEDISEYLIQQYFTNKLLDVYLKDDILKLLTIFQYVTGASTFQVLLAPVNTNMCRKFHTDINDLRMLCTYSGIGTLWLPDEEVNRSALDKCIDGACIVRDESNIQQASKGDVLILKGAIYPQDDLLACVHRSPTIEEFGGKRLLLRIDTNELYNLLN